MNNIGNDDLGLSSSAALLGLGKASAYKFKPEQIFYIRSRLNGQFLDVKNDSKSDGAQVITYPFNGNENQQWVIENLSGQETRIISVSSGKSLDIYESILSGKSIVINDKKDSNSQLFRYFQATGQITSAKYPKMCLDIKGASQAAGTAIILWNVKESYGNADAVNQQFDIISTSKQNVKNLDEYTTSNKMGGWNCSVSLTPPPDAKDRSKKFFKPLKHEKAILLEVAGSQLSNYITGGLVLLSHRATFKGIAGIYQDFTVMDEKPFRVEGGLSVDKNFIVNLSFLHDPKHLHQLFVHMIADRLISNWDTHNMNFAFSKNDQGGEDLISFDKEKCFYLYELQSNVLSAFSKVEDARRLNLTLNLWCKASAMANGSMFFMYSSLAHQILTGDVKIDFNHPIIQKMFERCESITMEKVKEFFEDYALVKYKAANAQEFLQFVYKRIKYIRRVVHVYFNWPIEKTSTHPEDPWIHEAGKFCNNN